jgi:hypothetical protein
MVFSDSSGGLGLLQECERICNLGAGGITSVAQKLKDFTARINNGIDRFYSIVFQYDVLWNFDDRNQTDLPIATTSLVSGTRDYQFDSELLQFVQAFAKDSSGTFHELTQQDDRNTPHAYLVDDSSGTPTSYELVGNSIIVNPAPNYNSSGGLKVVFKRNGVKFTATDSSQPVGIPTLFHSYLARFASHPFLLEKSLKHANAVKQQILEDEQAIRTFVSTRAKPRRAGLGVKVEKNR